MITFWIDGNPGSQGSKRHVGNGRLVESDKKLPAWRKAIETTVAELQEVMGMARDVLRPLAPSIFKD